MKRQGKKRLAVDLPTEMHEDLISVARLRNESIATIIKRLVYMYILAEKRT